MVCQISLHELWHIAFQKWLDANCTSHHFKDLSIRAPYTYKPTYAADTASPDPPLPLKWQNAVTYDSRVKGD
jgi:hypothetical protein